MLKQNINLTQVNDLQYKFYLDEDISNIVKPFNYNIIDKKLKSTDQSEIITFLLDHENSNRFGNLSYQFIIERLLLIKCKRLYVFNDSNSSGSIIKLIKLTKNFVDIFPDIKDATLESALFYFIANLNKVYWPNFSYIIVDKNSWNADISEVNSNEYKDVQFCIFENTNHSSFNLLSQEQLANYDIPNAENFF